MAIDLTGGRGYRPHALSQTPFSSRADGQSTDAHCECCHRSFAVADLQAGQHLEKCYHNPKQAFYVEYHAIGELLPRQILGGYK